MDDKPGHLVVAEVVPSKVTREALARTRAQLVQAERERDAYARVVGADLRIFEAGSKVEKDAAWMTHQVALNALTKGQQKRAWELAR